MKPHLLISPNQPEGTFVVQLVSEHGRVIEVGALMDAQRIAQAISAWTHLPIYEAHVG